MKRIGALNGMRRLILLLVLQAGYTDVVAARETDEPDSLRLELTPHDYVPLAVGNRWTYEHLYWNYSYPAGGGWFDLELLKVFEIPGYPHGYENPMPPDSLTLVERILTIEITHTEMIDGFEYFVFSDADYGWPPLPDLFWGGKKVRLSDEGFLVFRWDGQDVPIYDFSYHDVVTPYYTYSFNEYTVFPPSIEPSRMIRAIDPDDPEVVVFGADFWGQGGSYGSRMEFGQGESHIEFLHGYGVGTFGVLLLYTGYNPMFHVLLTPSSASIDGQEIPYPEHLLPLPYTLSSVQPTSWGQLKNSLLRAK